MTIWLTVALVLIGLVLYFLCSAGEKSAKVATLALWTYVVALLAFLLQFSAVIEIAAHRTH